MKSFAIALLLAFIISIIGSNANSSSNKITPNSNIESYRACLRIKEKVHVNLKCEKLIEFEKTQEVKILSHSDIQRRKVNKMEEKKLRKFLQQLSTNNKRLNE